MFLLWDCVHVAELPALQLWVLSCVRMLGIKEVSNSFPAISIRNPLKAQGKAC